MRPQAAAMKALFYEPGLQIMPGCGDGMGAHLIEEAGFRTGFISGSSIAAMRLAMPDMDLLTFPEMADAVEAVIAAAPGVLWLADGDTGYGNALAVQKTIHAYARRGAAAVLVEDKLWPRPLGHGGAKLVVERDAAILRCRAAVEACREEGVLLLARTDARISRGFDEALARLKAFEAEGADILFLDSPQDEAEMRETVVACNDKPALAVTSPAGRHFMPDNTELERLGIRLVVYPQEILAATVHAVRAALGGLKGGARPPMASPAELATAIRSAEYLARDARWPDPAVDDPQPMVPLSVLDLSPITEGSDAGQALRNSLDLAQHVEALGYRRFWMAEHHNLPGIASAATAVALAHVAAGTSTIRIGAGGIMLPNHAPLLIAEQFGTLAALHPGRVELGLGRAPGSDQVTARAVRRALLGTEESFPQEVVELMAYFRPAEPGQAVIAVPGAGLDVPLWILGSSLYGAQVAAYLGLPFAFASHFAPAMMMDAIRVYRARFRPSAQLSSPNVMLGVAVVAAESDEEARYLFSSLQQSTLNNRTGRRGRVPPPVENFEAQLDSYARAVIEDSLGCAIVGGADTVRRGLEDFIRRTGADELMVTANIFDHAKRRRSFEIVAEISGL